MSMNLNEVINGTLLGDASIKFDNYKYKKYFSYKITAKDRKFLYYLDFILRKYKLKTWITFENKMLNTYALYFYINSCPHKQFLKLRDKWYITKNNKSIKIIPKDLQLTPTVLLHWYLGDGSLPRRKNDKNRVPSIVLATNCFLKNDIDFLIKKLKELNLNFYPVKYKSGFTGKECGYCLYSRTQDGTPFRFFRMIGECPKEITNCITGSKGLGSNVHYFKDKWPTEDDWIKILSNVKGIGRIIKERRIEMDISRKELTKLLKVNKDYIRKIEYGKRNPSVRKFKKVLKALNINTSYLLSKLVEK
jgi:DNA-binding XRE family transcriptional regulator